MKRRTARTKLVRWRRLALLVPLGLGAAAAQADDPGEAFRTPALTQEREGNLAKLPAAREVLRQRAQHGQRIDLLDPPVLDPMIFTEISPYAIEQDAVRLPEEQRLE